MAKFQDRRDGLAKSRAAEASAEKDLAAARYRVDRLERQHQQRSRSGAQIAELDGDLEQARRSARAARDKLAEARKLALRDRGLFSKFTDPREQANQLPDDIPVLLMPLRLETRFKGASETKSGSDELWVRVYPDDIFIDSFEDSLSQTE